MRRASVEAIALACWVAFGAVAGCGVFFEEDLAPPTASVTGTWAGVENVAITTDNVGNPVGKLYPVAFGLAQSGAYVSGTFDRVSVVDNAAVVDRLNVRGTVAKNKLALLREFDAAVAYMLTVGKSESAGQRLDGVRSYGAYEVKTVATFAAWTGPAASVFADNATLTGGANPAGYDTNVWFEWGVSPTLSTYDNTAIVHLDPGVHYGPVASERTIVGLQAGTNYYYRIVCANDLVGTARGSIVGFRTP